MKGVYVGDYGSVEDRNRVVLLYCSGMGLGIGVVEAERGSGAGEAHIL